MRFHRLQLPLFMAIATQLSTSCAPAQEVAPRHLAAQNRSSYAWKNVAVSGIGCWVTGIEVHPKGPHVTYMRTDVGGVYRWDEVGARWISLSNHFTYPEANYYGVESLALDVNAPDTVYMACGAYTDKGDGAVFKSVDRGANWTKLGLRVPMGSNQARRWGGERLAVSRRDGRVLLFGSRRDGLLRSTDGGKNWTKNAQIPVAQDNLGVLSVAFDPANASVVYAAVSGAGIYQSRDEGANWALVPDGPLDVRRLIVGANGALWATHGAGVSKWSNGKWGNFAPGGEAVPYVGIAINPRDPQDILVQRPGRQLQSSRRRAPVSHLRWRRDVEAFARRA